MSPDLLLLFSFIMHSVRLGAWPSPHPRGVRRAVISTAVLAAVAFAVSLTGVHAAEDVQRPNCSHFLDQEDAQATLEVDPSNPDPFNLDGNNDGEACQDPEDEIGTERPLVNCDDFVGKTTVAGALYRFTREAYDEDRYNLASCADTTARDVPLADGYAPEASLPREIAPTVEAPIGDLTVGSSGVHPYVAYMAEGGVPIGAHTFGLVTRGQAAAGASDGQQAATAQAADDESPRERKASRRKAKRDKKHQAKNQQSQQSRHNRGDSAKSR